MKKVLIVLLVLILLPAAALAVFVGTFDANRFRPMITEKASQALGAPVDIGRIALVWQNGIALRLQDLTVYSDPQKKAASVKVKEIGAVVRLMPLLQKKIEIASIVVQAPAVHLVKTADGAVQIKGVNLSAASASKPAGAPSGSSASKAPGAVPEVSIGTFRVRDAQVVFDDLTHAPPMRYAIKDVDADVKNFSLTRPFNFDVRANLMGTQQNVSVSGRMTLPQGGKGGVLENVAVSTDLDDWNLADIAKAAPAAASVRDLSGNLGLQLGRLALDDLKSLKADLTLKDGRVKADQVRGALENIQLASSVGGGDLKVKNFSADFGGGTLKANGVVKQFSTRALSGFSASAHDLILDQLLPESSGKTRLNGKLSLDFEGQAAGLAWPQMSQTLDGSGRLQLKDGVLLNTNLLRQVIEKLSIIPGAGDAIKRRLPPDVIDSLNKPSTILKPTDIPFTVRNGFVVFNQLNLDTDFLAVRGAGQLALADNSVSSRAAVLLDTRLSQTIAGSVPQIQVILNPQGQIEIPVTIQGKLPHVAVLPDTEYLTQKLLAQQLTSLVQNPEESIQKVRNLLDKPAQAGESGVQNSVAGLLDSKDGLKNLFQQALNGDSQQAAAPATEQQTQ